MEELLQHDASTTSLFGNRGLMAKSVKSDIVHELEAHLTDQDPKEPKLD